MRRLALATASLLLLAAPALADLAAGRAAFEAGDYAAAVQALEPAAWEGQAEAQFLLARCHENGWGVPRSEPRAFAWYKRAGDKAHPEAQLRLGELFELGQGVPISLRQAADWYRHAANTGQMRAKTRLGLINLHGRGQRPNLVRAAALLGEAAAAGDAEARAALDDMARRGLVKATPQGEESPAAPEARRILSEARAALAAWGKGEAGRLRLGAPARIDSREDHYVLVLPELELTDPQASLRLGTVLVAVMPQSDDTYALELRLPARIGIAFAEHPDRIRPVSIRDHRITGRWSGTLGEFQAEFTGMQVPGPHGLVAIDRVSARNGGAAGAEITLSRADQLAAAPAPLGMLMALLGQAGSDAGKPIRIQVSLNPAEARKMAQEKVKTDLRAEKGAPQDTKPAVSSTGGRSE